MTNTVVRRGEFLNEPTLRRSARSELAAAVCHNRAIPIWQNGRLVWKVPREELAALEAILARP